MRKFVCVMFMIASTFVAIGGDAKNNGQETELKQLCQGNLSAAVGYYKETALAGQNVCLSPFSISAAFSMVYEGAKGETADELKVALGFDMNLTELNDAWKNLNTSLNGALKSSDMKLSIANGLCLVNGDLGAAYKNLLKTYYDAEIFPGNLETINTWVANKTEQKIKKLLDSLDNKAVGVLLNAIYFKGLWANAFDPEQTRDSDFTTGDGKKIIVPMMSRKGDYRMLETPALQAIALPYKEDKISMILLMPSKASDITALEKSIDASSLARVLEDLDREFPRETGVYVPRFKLETDYDLIPIFRKMGVSLLFGGDADLSGTGLPKGELCVSQAVHKAFIEVNEEGTEAAAATAVTMLRMSFVQPREFRADKPFIYIIRENGTGSILFIGKIVDPSQS
ncbi:MAG: serpin family protein [Lentisphaerae bacterium]|nr:serpin family protein [Lentisphaerota bacterium]